MMMAAVAASASMLVSAQSLSDTQTLWGKVFKNSNIVGTSPTSAGYGLAQAADGSLLTLGNVGSKAATENLLFGDDILGTGTPYGGNSNNLDLCITKVNPDGTLAWKIMSKYGEVDNSEGACIVGTPDGGAVTYVNMRPSEGYTDNGVVIVDAQGTEYAMPMELNGARHYESAVIKIDANGKIEWLKQFTINAVADKTIYAGWTQGTTNIGQGIYAYGLEVDNAGNIYVAGRMVADITIGDVTITPHNVSDWIGDSQKPAGNMYIIKLDSEGNYVKHLVTGGEATGENARTLKVVGNDLYLFGLIEGKANTEITLGGKSVTPTNANNSLFAAKFDTDLNVNWFQLYQSTMSGSALQMPTLSVIDNKLYLMGTAKMGMAIGDKTFATVNVRDPWMVQVNAATGEAVNCLTYKDGQHGFFGAFEGTDGYLYAVERGLGSMNPMASLGNVHMGTAIHKIDPEAFTTTPADGVVLIDKTADGYGIQPIGNKLYIYDRLPNGNKTATYTNSDLSFTSSAFLGRLSAFQLPVGAVQSLTLNYEEATIGKGQTLSLIATLLPENTVNSRVIWSSSDESVATVDDNGVVTAADSQAAPARIRKVNAGENVAIITATSASNSNVKAHVKVTVDNATAITTINADVKRVNNNVYTIDGRLVKAGDTSVAGLPAGLYIAGGKKVVVR